MSDVTITYKGSPIATMDASGTKTLTTQGKYCEANIGVEYVKPSGGTPAIAIVDTPDSHGGVEREITALNISDSTLETADQLAQGVTAYNKSGVKLTGTASVGSINFPVIRPDAELVQRWSVDHLLVADDGITLSEAPMDAKVDFIASEELPDITTDAANYKYFVNQRAIAYPVYSSSEIGRGRFEYSLSESCYEALSFDSGEFVALVNSEKNYPNGSFWFVGSSQYRGIYFTASSGAMSVYTSATYGLYIVFSSPAITGSTIRLSTPTLSARCQVNIYDEPFWNLTTDIRYQYIIEIWRAPRGTDQDMNGWSNMMQIERSLGCVLSPSHTLT